MDTVLGLSLTSTSVGWVLVDGHEADGAILDHDEFTAPAGGGTSAVRTSRQVAAAVSRAEAAASARDRRLHTIGMTWSDDAAAGAALLVETLTAAGFDNVVPVRTVAAAETLAQGLAPVVGYDKTVVCVLERAAATVVTVDAGAEEIRTAATTLADGSDDLLELLSRMFANDDWQPDCVVVVGSEVGSEELASQLHDALPVPVFAQSGAELALARGAALASAHAGFTDAVLAGSTDDGGVRRFRPLSYRGALTALIAGAVALVGSLSLVVGLRVTSDDEVRPSERVVHAAAAPRMPEPPAAPPAPAPPPAAVPAEPPPASAPEPPVAEAPEPAAQQPAEESPADLPEQPAAPPAAPPAPPPPPEPEAPPPDPHPLLTKILNQLRGQPPDPAPAQPPDAPPPPP